MLASGVALAATLKGNEGNNRLVGTNKAGTIYALGGNDQAYGGTGRDTLEGEGGADEVSGDSGPDTMDGGVSEIYGSPSEDDITGSTDASGDDFIDYVDCGRLQSPTAGWLDNDTAPVDEIDFTVECENTAVSSPTP